MPRKIIVKVDRQGGTEIRTEGFQGESCLAATKNLEKLLGSVIDDTPTPEMWEQAESGKEYLRNDGSNG